jgi:hypothetical protein
MWARGTDGNVGRRILEEHLFAVSVRLTVFATGAVAERKESEIRAGSVDWQSIETP